MQCPLHTSVYTTLSFVDLRFIACKKNPDNMSACAVRVGCCLPLSMCVCTHSSLCLSYPGPLFDASSTLCVGRSLRVRWQIGALSALAVLNVGDNQITAFPSGMADLNPKKLRELRWVSVGLRGAN